MAKKDKGVLAGDPVTYQIPDPAGGVQLETFIPWTLIKRGVKREVITPLNSPTDFRSQTAEEHQRRKAEQHGPLLRALGLAHYWQSLLDDGKYQSITDIAAAEGINRGRVSRISQLAYLAPEVIEAYLTGNAPELTLEHCFRQGIPTDWDLQRRKKPISGS